MNPIQLSFPPEKKKKGRKKKAKEKHSPQKPTSIRAFYISGDPRNSSSSIPYTRQTYVFTPRKPNPGEILLQFVRRLSSPLVPTPDTCKTVQKKSRSLSLSLFSSFSRSRHYRSQRRSAGIHQHRSRGTSVNAEGLLLVFVGRG